MFHASGSHRENKTISVVTAWCGASHYPDVLPIEHLLVLSPRINGFRQEQVASTRSEKVFETQKALQFTQT